MENLKDKEYVKLINSQFEIYLQKIELLIKERENVKTMFENELPDIENSLKNENNMLEILKNDRTKDQTTIFELERKLGFLQVHYTYDKAKLLANTEVREEQEIEIEIKKKAENLLARVAALIKEVPE